MTESNDSSLLVGSESRALKIMDNFSSSVSSKELSTMLESNVVSLVCHLSCLDGIAYMHQQQIV